LTRSVIEEPSKAKNNGGVDLVQRKPQIYNLPSTGVPLRAADGGTEPLASNTTEADLTTVIQPAGRQVVTPFFHRTPPLSHEHFRLLRQWEGVVTEVYASYFAAEVIDLDTNERAIVEFDIGDVSPADRTLCDPGALFYWSIGYDVKRGGQQSRASVLWFRRLG
jgi:hypothetical protein